MKLAAAIVLATCTNAVTIRLNGTSLPCQPTAKVEFVWSSKEIRVGGMRITGIDSTKWPALQYIPGAVLITGREVPLFRSGFE